MKIEQKIRSSILEVLEDNPGGLTYNELYHRLERKHRSINKYFLNGLIGKMFRSNEIMSERLDDLKLLKRK